MMPAPSAAPPPEASRPERFVFLLLENFTLIAFAGAIEPLRLANRMSGRTLYDWQVVSATGGPVTASNGVVLQADGGLDALGREASILVVGGLNVKQAISRPVLTWLRRESRKGLAIGALCTGAQVIAQAGLLDGRRCTIHWENRDSFEEDFPEIDLTQNIYVIDRDRYTAAGGTASTDLMLKLIARKHGIELANLVADQMIHTAIRSDKDAQRLSIPTRIGVRHPKLAIGDPAHGGAYRGAGLAAGAGPGRRHVDPPARAAVPPLPQPQPEALLHGAAPRQGAQPAAADRHERDQRGAGLRLRLALALLEVLPGALQDHPLPRARSLRGPGLKAAANSTPPRRSRIARKPSRRGAMPDPVVIVSAARTPLGGFQGALAPATAPELGGVAIAAALARAGIPPDAVDELLMGCVLPAGQGQAPARQAGFAAGLPKEVPATTVNKMCGSGMKAVMLAHDALRAGAVEVVVAGGMESMSNAPYLLPKMRAGARLGHASALDHMFLDGLEDAYDKGRLMGTFAEDCATEFQFTRADQDAYALASLTRARDAQGSGAFAAEIAPVTVTTRAGAVEVTEDEQPRTARPEKIPTLKPAFRKDGTVTPANSSSISDGAAALVLMRESEARARGLPVRARVLGHASHAQEPARFPTAPVPAAQKLLQKLGWTVGDVDLWEVNEAFAVVPMAFMAETGAAHQRLNVYGGACALGHPIGASGARILVTLLNALERQGGSTGLAAICIGGGEGTAVALERA